MGRRTLLLIASILVAAVGTALIGLYVRGADDRALQDVKQKRVLVAVKDIIAGTTPTEDDYRFVARTSGDLPSDYLTAADQIKGKAVSTILAGSTLQARMFAASGAAPAGNDVTKGYRGVAFDLEDPQRVAGLLTPGSWVTIYATPKTDTGKAKTREVFGDTLVRVISIGSQAVSKPAPTTGISQEAAVPRAVVTLDLPRNSARQLVEISQTESLAFGLASAADAPTPANS